MTTEAGMAHMEAQQIQPLAAVFGRGVPCAENDKGFAAEAMRGMECLLASAERKTLQTLERLPGDE